MESTRRRLAAPALLLALAACRSDKPEDQVKAAFDQMVKAVEAGDAAGVADRLDPDFRGPENLDKAGARYFLMGVFRQGKVGVSVLENRARLQGREVDQTVGLVLTQQGSGLLPDASRRNFLLRWKERKGDWLLAEVEELGPQS